MVSEVLGTFILMLVVAVIIYVPVAAVCKLLEDILEDWFMRR